MTGNPQYIVQQTTSGAYQVVRVDRVESVDGVEYASFDEAKALRDLLNQAHESALVTAGGAR